MNHHTVEPVLLHIFVCCCPPLLHARAPELSANHSARFGMNVTLRMRTHR